MHTVSEAKIGVSPEMLQNERVPSSPAPGCVPGAGQPGAHGALGRVQPRQHRLSAGKAGPLLLWWWWWCWLWGAGKALLGQPPFEKGGL
eukprot:gene17487-biopygen23348